MKNALFYMFLTTQNALFYIFQKIRTPYFTSLRVFRTPYFTYFSILLRSFGGATRGELNTLLQSKLSDVLTDEQKNRKIGNLLSSLKKSGVIKLTQGKKWVLVKV